MRASFLAFIYKKTYRGGNKMTKSFKKVTKATLAAALVSSALVPAAVVGAETPATQNDVTKVVISQGGKNLEITLALFEELLVEGELSIGDVAYITDGKGNHYTLGQFNEALAELSTPTFAGALDVLEDANLAADIETVEAEYKDGKLVAIDGTPSELAVESASAINPTTIQVTFNEDVTEETLATSNFTLSKGTLEGVSAVGNIVTISVAGLTYGDAVTVTVGNPAYTKEVTVPEVSELFLLEITTDAENDVILSDGASKTQVTVTLKDRATGEVVDQDGIVQFQATNGGLGQTTSALVDGKASVQLTSEASATSITSILTATISDVPGAGEFKGLTAQKAIIFSPKPAENETVEFVSPVYAEAKAGDRFFVQFSDKITAKDYKDAINATNWNKASKGHGIAIDGKLINVKDVKQVTDNTLEFILDTDLSTGASFTPANTHTRIESGWAGASFTALGSVTKNYLRDNVQHVITFPENVGKVVLATTGSNVKFNLTDTSKPAVLGVTAKDQIEFSVRFTEAVDERTVEQLNTQAVAPNFLLDGKQVVVISNPTAGEIAAAKSANRIILNSLTVGSYNATTGVDTRNIVTFKVDPEFALAGGTHIIQVANVTDWAGDVDPVQNTVVTDTFSFNVTVDNAKPVAAIETHSQEQFLITYDKVVSTVPGKTVKDVFTFETGNSEDDELVYGTDYVVYEVDKDGISGKELAATDSISNSQYFLVEMKRDWTEIYDTKENTSKTYHASAQNPYTITVENVRSLVGNVADKQELKVSLAYDGVSPKLVSATDVYTLEDKQYATNTNTKTPGKSTAVTASGKEILVTFNEPIKVNSDGLRADEGKTPSQVQHDIAANDIPASTYEFVKDGKVIKAEVIPGSIAANDKSFVLRPVNNQQLEAGEWTVNIRSLTDDIGNAIATEHFTVTIVPSAAVETDTQVAWAAFDDAVGTGKLVDSEYAGKDVIYVKFTKEMKADGANGVGSTQNYVFRGQQLSTLGSEAQVLRGIQGVTNDWDGVTIVVPAGTWDGTGALSADFSAVFNVAQNFVSADGEKLSGDFEFELTDRTTALNAGFEAVYAQGNGGTFGDVKAATIGATATGADGYIDAVTLTFDNEPITIKPNTEIRVNGKAFINVAGTTNSSTATFTAKANDQRVNGTTTDNLVIKSVDGAILVNNKSVVDAVAPVVTKAEVKDGEIAVTFSEAIEVTGAVNFSDLLQIQDDTGAVAATQIDENAKEIGSNYLVFDIKNTGSAISIAADSTIDVLTTLGATGINLEDKAGITAAEKGAAYVVGSLTDAMWENDVKISGITTATPGVTVTGVTATSATMTQEGVVAAAGSNTTWTVPTDVVQDAVFEDNSTNGDLLGYEIVFVDGGAAATTAAAVSGTTITVTLPTAGDTVDNVLAALQGASGVVTGSDLYDALAGITETGANDSAADVIDPTATATYAAGTPTVLAQAAIGEFKVATGATKSGNVTVTITETIPGSPATVNVYTKQVAVTAGQSAATVAGNIAGASGTWTPATTTPVTPAATFAVTAAGDTLTITQGTGSEGPSTYTVTVQ